MLGYLTGRLAETSTLQSLATGPGREHPPGVEREKGGLVVRNLDPRESESERIDERAFRRSYHLPESGPGRRIGSERAPPGPRRPSAG